jgi:hypothetical protein
MGMNQDPKKPRFKVVSTDGALIMAIICNVTYVKYDKHLGTERGNKLFADVLGPLDGKTWSTNSMERLEERALAIWREFCTEHEGDALTSNISKLLKVQPPAQEEETQQQSQSQPSSNAEPWHLEMRTSFLLRVNTKIDLII